MEIKTWKENIFDPEVTNHFEKLYAASGSCRCCNSARKKFQKEFDYYMLKIIKDYLKKEEILDSSNISTGRK